MDIFIYSNSAAVAFSPWRVLDLIHFWKPLYSTRYSISNVCVLLYALIFFSQLGFFFNLSLFLHVFYLLTFITHFLPIRHSKWLIISFIKAVQIIIKIAPPLQILSSCLKMGGNHECRVQLALFFKKNAIILWVKRD